MHEVNPSAIKHGVTNEDALAAATNYLMTIDLDQGLAGRELRLGFDTRGRLLETVVVIFDDRRPLIIHAMKARKAYRKLIA